MTKIRRLEQGDWALYRDIRLAMLADTPTAYVEPFESASRQTDGQWQARTATMVSPGNITFVAGDAPGSGRLEALMWVALKKPQDLQGPRQAILLSVFVTGRQRGTGLADSMLRRCIAAARDELQADLLELGVHEDNGRAQRFYLRHGFRDTGRREPYPLDPAARELVMELQLKPAADGGAATPDR